MKERLVLVEDDSLNLKLLTCILEPCGYQLFTAMSGNEALKIVEKYEPDLILLDIRLPDISGYEICEKLQAQEKTKLIPIIFTSAMAQKENRIKGLALGAADYITKPYYKEEVILRIENRLKLSRIEKELKETIENQALLLDHIDPMVWYLKDARTLGKVNKSFADFFHRKKEDLENFSLKEILPLEEYTNCLEGNEQVFNTKLKAQHQQIQTNGAGEKRMLAITKIPKLNKQGEVDYVICSADDVTERNRKEEKIRYLTFHDSLTGLYNRTFYEEEIRRLDVERKLPLSIITCDVNGLKFVNDIFGHHIGDRLLVKVAKNLKSATRTEDIVARWGGDEFVVLLPNTSKKEVLRITERINELMMDQTVEFIPVSLASGFATKESNRENIQQILKKAEERMYRDKSNTKDNKNDSLLKRFTKKFEGLEFKDLQHTPEMHKNGKRLGIALKLDKREQKRLDLLIKYHDIGKISIPRNVLEKGAPLTDREWEQYKDHVEIGYRIAKTIPELGSVAKEILHHHENFDGKGFPGTRQGKEIPYLSRILAVLDIYDGLGSSIYYLQDQEEYFKAPLSNEEVKEEIQNRSNTFFDPEIVQVFMEKVAI